MKIVYPPDRPVFIDNYPSVFLAGSIEMGAAVDWQTRACKALTDKAIVILNPRRVDWDSSWEQTLDSPKFVEQVTWELDMLDRADLVVVYFDPNTKAPITLMELGLHANTTKQIVVCCPGGFWRKGNVEIVCQRYNIPMVAGFDELLVYLDNWAPNIGEII